MNPGSHDLSTQVGDSPSAANSGRIDYIHNFRGLAILFIVATHVLSVFDWSEDSETERALRYFFANGTIFFLFISGFLFEYLRHRFKPLPYWRQKVRFVVLPYLFCSLPALIVYVGYTERADVSAGFYAQPAWLQVLTFLCTGSHAAPFWFIPTIIIFYVTAPLLHKLFERSRSFILLPLLFVIPAIISRSSNPLLNLLHLLPIWVMGMAACRFRGLTEQWLPQHAVTLSILAFALGITEYYVTAGTHTFIGYLQKAALLLVLMAALIRLGRFADRPLAWYGVLSFGIFFVHTYVITVLKWAAVQVLGHVPSGSILAMLAMTALAALASAAVVKTGMRILATKSRYVLGV